MASNLSLPTFDITKEALTSGWGNNCGLHCFVHKLIEMLNDPTSTAILLADENYQQLLKSFAEYYDLNEQNPSARLKTLYDMLGSYPSPVDQERLLAPVLRIFLQKLLNNVNNVDKIWGSPPEGTPHEKAMEYRSLETDFANFLENGYEAKGLDRMIGTLDNALRDDQAPKTPGPFSKMHTDYQAEIKTLADKSPPKSEINAVIKNLIKPGGDGDRPPYSILLSKRRMHPTELENSIILETAKRLRLTEWRNKAIIELNIAPNTKTPDLLDKLKTSSVLTAESLLTEWKEINELNTLSEAEKKATLEKVSPADRTILTRLTDPNVSPDIDLDIRMAFIKKKWLELERDKIKTRYQKKAKDLFHTKGYPVYAAKMGDINNNIMTTEFELVQLAEALNIALGIYKDTLTDKGMPVIQRQFQYSPSREKRGAPYGELKIRHLGLHWQYESNKDEEALKSRNALYEKNAVGNKLTASDPAILKNQVQASLQKPDMQKLQATQAAPPLPSAAATRPNPPKRTPPPPPPKLTTPVTSPKPVTPAPRTPPPPPPQMIPQILTQFNMPSNSNTCITSASKKLSLEQVHSNLSTALDKNSAITLLLKDEQADQFNIADFAKPSEPVIATISKKNDITTECNIHQNIGEDTAKLILNAMINDALQDEKEVQFTLSSTSLEDISVFLSAIIKLKGDKPEKIISLDLDPKTKETLKNPINIDIGKKLLEEYYIILAISRSQRIAFGTDMTKQMKPLQTLYPKLKPKQ